MKLLFAGTPDFAVPTLEQLSGSHSVVAVLTSPDKKAGRGKKTLPSAVAAAAERLRLPVEKPERLGADARRTLSSYEADLLVCVAYGRIFGPKFLKLFPRGGINLHPSLLPKYRGPAPIPAAILAGESETGITVQYLGEKMDAGEIILQTSTPLTGTETTGELTRRFAVEGAALVQRAVSQLERGTACPRPQDEQAATYCGLIRSEDSWIDWTASAVDIDRMIRAYTPWPGARTLFGDSWLKVHAVTPVGEVSPGGPVLPGSASPGTVVGVDSTDGILVQTGDGLLAVRELQLQARKSLPWRDFLNGVDVAVGTVFHTREK